MLAGGFGPRGPPEQLLEIVLVGEGGRGAAKLEAKPWMSLVWVLV